MSADNLPNDLKFIFQYVDAHKTEHINNLREAVAIKSVSAWPETRDEITKMIDWTVEQLQALGATIELADLGIQTLSDGKTLPLPNVILGTLGNDPTKKTVCIYGHLDVQPALREDGWNTDPFVLTEIDGKLYGRGSTDDKGPVLCWIHAIQAYQALHISLPVNVKFIFEAMEESDSVGLDDMLTAKRDTFLKNIDYICISDNYWLGTEKPCITYGLRGICYFYLEVECADKDLHSGVFGGTVYEAMNDLIYLLGTLTDDEGRILVPNLYREVAPLQPNEEEIYKKITFDVDAYRTNVGATKLLHKNDKVQLLMHRWRYPSLSVHGIEGAFSESGQKTVIPRKVTGKFSIRIVPNQEPKQIEKYVCDYLNEKFAKRSSTNRMRCTMVDGCSAWSEDPNHPHYQALATATKHVYKMEPDMVREGGTIAITLMLQQITGKNIALLPVGASDDGAHSQNEKINIRNYVEGTKLLAAYLYEVAKLH